MMRPNSSTERIAKRDPRVFIICVPLLYCADYPGIPVESPWRQKHLSHARCAAAFSEGVVALPDFLDFLACRESSCVALRFSLAVNVLPQPLKDAHPRMLSVC